jgi:monovalent cation/proton antiporter MnhG/PhaG subunit
MVEAIGASVGAVLLLLGLAVTTVGLYGLLRRPEIFEQLHAAGLVTGPGVILVLLASVATGNVEIITSAVLVIAFVLVTSSLSTHAIALAAWRQRSRVAMRRSTGAGGRGAPDRATDPAPLRVLVAHDGSGEADVAVRLVAGLGWPRGSAFRLIAVMDGDLTPITEAALAPEVVPAEPVELASMRAAAGLLADAGLKHDQVVRSGQPAAAIVEEAEQLGADLVVVGSRGLGRVRSLLEGSVAADVVDRAPCPVLVARSERIDRVLLATDGSGPSAAATELLAGWPIFEGVHVQVAMVAASVARADPTADGGPDRMAGAAARRLRAAGRRAVPHVLVGDAASSIVDFARSEGVDLIVMGSRGRTGLTRALLGSVAREVLSTAESSVLIVRGSGEGPAGSGGSGPRAGPRPQSSDPGGRTTSTEDGTPSMT